MPRIISGAMYGGQLLPKDEFVTIVSQMIIENQQLLKNELMQIETSIATSPQAAFMAWERFQKNIMHNPKTQLLSILNFYDKNNSQTWVLTNEEDAIEPSGLINVQRVGKEIRNEYNSQILSKHLGQMFNTVTKTEISKTALNYLLKNYQFRPKLNKGDKKTYANVFWSKQEQGFKMRGQVAEAFLTHVAKMHLSTLDSNEKLSIDFSNQSILKKETPKGFVDILYASKNRDAWFTGGDLIVTNSQGEVIANIQLKTSGGLGTAIGSIKTTQLKSQIEILKNKLGQPQEMAEHFYNMLSTSGVMVEIDQKIDQSGYNLIDQIFQRFV